MTDATRTLVAGDGPPRRERATGTSPPWVLVIATAPDRQELLERKLMRAGFSVEIATCAESAIGRLGVIIPAFIVIDHTLPDADRALVDSHLEQLKHFAAAPELRVIPSSALETRLGQGEQIDRG